MKQSLIGNLKKGLIFVVSAPAGTGKTTLTRMLTDEFSCVVESISSTTRSIRPGEIHGKDYHFLNEMEFQAKIEAEEFLEFTHIYGAYYGTSKKTVQELQEKGKHVVLVIDTQGAMKLKGKIPAVFIFIRPPSLAELRVRLFNRKTEDDRSIQERLAWAEKEIEAAQHYDYLIVNENLQMAYEILRSIVIAEEHHTRRD